MDNKPISPRRPRGAGSVADPSVATEHSVVEPERKKYAGSSRSSLFGLFRRQPSRSNLVSPPGAQSLRSNAMDSYYGAFDNISVGTTVTGLESPQQAHATSDKVGRMLAAAQKYRESIEAMSAAAIEFGNTLYECADTKGAASAHTSLPDHTVDTDLQAAGGLHLLISSHLSILASSVVSNVEEPLQYEFKLYKERIADKEQEFKVSLRRKLAALREADMQRQRDARKRRDLGSYRSSLLDLTYQIDDINRLKVEFLGDIHVLSSELAENIHASTASTVTAEIEVFESIARKGWSGGGLDGLLAGCPDPFESTQPRVSTMSTTIPAKSSEDKTNANSTYDSSLDTFGASSLTNGNRPRSSTQKSADFDGSFDLSKRTEGSSKHHSRSPNLFSVIPPGPILPASLHDTEDVSDDDEEHRSEDHGNGHGHGNDNGNDNGHGSGNDNGHDSSPSNDQNHGNEHDNNNIDDHNISSPLAASSPKKHSKVASDLSDLASLTLTPVHSNEHNSDEPPHSLPENGANSPTENGVDKHASKEADPAESKESDPVESKESDPSESKENDESSPKENEAM